MMDYSQLIIPPFDFLRLFLARSSTTGGFSIIVLPSATARMKCETRQFLNTFLAPLASKIQFECLDVG